MAPETALVFLAVITLPALYAAWSDMRSMTIPNGVSLVLLVLFLLTAPFVLPLGEVAIRLGWGFAILALGFALTMAGVMGGGDAKFLAAVTPFIAPELDHATFFMQILGLMALSGIVTHRLFGRIGAIRQIAPGWESWQERRHFPFGVSIAGAILYYLALIGFVL